MFIGEEREEEEEKAQTGEKREKADRFMDFILFHPKLLAYRYDSVQCTFHVVFCVMHSLI